MNNPEYEWLYPKTNPMLKYPVDVTKHKIHVLDFDTQYITNIYIAIKERVLDWSIENFGYAPQLSIVTLVDNSAGAYLLMFASEHDGILFRMWAGV